MTRMDEWEAEKMKEELRDAKTLDEAKKIIERMIDLMTEAAEY